MENSKQKYKHRFYFSSNVFQCKTSAYKFNRKTSIAMTILLSEARIRTEMTINFTHQCIRNTNDHFCLTDFFLPNKYVVYSLDISMTNRSIRCSMGFSFEFNNFIQKPIKTIDTLSKCEHSIVIRAF